MTWYFTHIQLEFVYASMEIIAIYDKHVILKMIHFFIGNLYLLRPIFEIFKSRPSNGFELWSLSCKQFMYMNKDKTTIYIITKQKWGEWENRRTDFWLLMKFLCMEKNVDICSSYNAPLSFETYENNL